MKKELKLIQMSQVEVEDIKWVWYPYIPYGKITVVQGDPGEGKTTFVLALIALLTQGKPLPEEENGTEPIKDTAPLPPCFSEDIPHRCPSVPIVTVMGVTTPPTANKAVVGGF